MRLRLSFVSTVLLFVSLAGRASADEASAYRNAVTTNPARYAVLHFQIEYERVIGAGWTTFVAPIAFHHATWYPFAPSDDDATATGYGLDAGARWFWSGDAPRGWFVGPYLSAYAAEVEKAGETTLEGSIWSPGAQLGYTHLIGRWMLSAGGGVSYGFATEEAPGDVPKAEQLPHRGVWLNFRFNAGLSF